MLTTVRQRERHNLTHWGRVTHICVGSLTITGSDNGLSPGRRQAIIWTNAGIVLIGPLGTNFSEISIEILAFSFKKMCLKLSSAKWCPFCLGLNVLSPTGLTNYIPYRGIILCVCPANRRVSQMRAPLAACRKPTGNYSRLLYFSEN